MQYTICKTKNQGDKCGKQWKSKHETDHTPRRDNNGTKVTIILNKLKNQLTLWPSLESWKS